MAGGQERILRRRIRSVQSTKKITRAMELIAASRIVKAQARVQAARAVRRRDHRGRARPRRGRRGRRQPAAHAARRRSAQVAHVVIAADRGLCGGYNSSVIRAAEGDDARARRARRATTGSSSSAARPRATSASATTGIDGVVHRVLRPADVRGRARDRGGGRGAVPRRRVRPRAARLHALRLGRARRRSSCGR